VKPMAGLAAGWRLLPFAGLVAVCAVAWATLIDSPPGGRIVLISAIAVAGAAVLEAVSRLRRPLAARRILAAAACVAIAVAALLAAGIPLRLLVPGGWGELGEGLGDGIRELGDTNYPYRGPEEWSRLILLAGLAAILVIAAALTAWPRRDPAGGQRLAGLAMLLGGYVAAVAIGDGGEPLWAGLLILGLVAAWLWLPRIAARRRTVVIAGVAAAGLVAVPAAAALDGDEPWVNYESWTWGPLDNSVSYEWNHRYGPLDWPRDGTTLFEVESEQPHYWRATVLDSFDGTSWQRVGQAVETRELPTDVEGSDAALKPDWSPTVGVTIGALRSSYVVAPGYARSVDGINSQPVGDGTTLTNALAEPGDGYEVTGYEPDPGSDQLRAASEPYPRGVARYTQLELSTRLLQTADPDEVSSLALTRPIRVPLRNGTRASLPPDAREAIAESGYARVYELARELTDDRDTPYGAVRAVDRFLGSNAFAYSENPPTREVPLRAFLLNDRIGYCQHFSGAMALLLRMVGIPARVATGFSPGTPIGANEYQVTDLDAHSWVEVYFTGIGWVPFDPTPGVAPANSQAAPGDLTAAPSRGLLDLGNFRRQRATPDQTQGAGAPSPAGDESDGGPAAIVLAGLAVLGVGAAGSATALRRRRFAGLPPAVALSAQADEIRGALPRAGLRVPPGATALAMERRLRRAARPRAAAYLAKLGDARYAPGSNGGPTLRERRAVRRELRRGRPIRDRLRGLLTMPPGGPRPLPPG
jgi:protein-glutamine gamma-glutamyltransferase